LIEFVEFVEFIEFIVDGKRPNAWNNWCKVQG